MKRLIVLLIAGLSCAVTLQAQEICNNAKDDDGDGFIDCYDRDCSVSTFCKDFFLGEDAQCEVTPPAFPKFTMSLDFSSPDETTNHLARMAVGDLNRDGKPEIITMNRYTKRLFILNGTDGSIQQQATVSFEPQWEIAIGNVDNDNCAEIFFWGTEGSDNYLYAYDCSLNFLWKSSNKLRGDPINYGLADFDGDGKSELYIKDEIYDAHTGTRIVKSTASNWRQINGGPVAVDMEGDDKLELVIGCAIYNVNLGDRSADSGSLTLLKNRADYFIRYEFNATSVADYNLDGYLDVLASGSTTSHGANTTVFFWDVKNDAVKTYSDPIPGDFTVFACPTSTGQYYKNGWQNGTGRINIADLDGDGKLNISYVSGKFLYALNENLEPMPWSPKVVNEETSGHTGCTLFDFNGDGKSEIVYRDERYLYIINGIDGSIYNQQACVSRTNREYPIVADVDADGSTELCVTCGFDDNASINNFCNLGYSRYSHVRVFKSAADPWVPARRVWNQHGYFNVNVNDDLTIPAKQQKHHLVFSSGSCTVGPNRPLNGFLNQSPFLNIDGCPTYKSPDLAFVDNSLQVKAPTCPSQNFTVTFQVKNVGDLALSGDVPITFYKGNPTQAGAVKLNTLVVPMSNLGVDGTQAVTDVTVTGPGGPFTLYIVLNDNGSTVPTPIHLPNTSFLECDYGNNILSSPVNPLPVAITALKVQDNIKCASNSVPDNGAVRAFIPTTTGGENTTDYNFYWSKGTTAKPVPADYQGAAVNGLAEGTYTVFAVHKTAGCSSGTASVTIGKTSISFTANIKLVNPYTNCKIPDGSLKVTVNDPDGDGVGEDPTKYTYTWYEGNDIFTDPEVSIDATAKGLKPLTYTAVVTEIKTGCQSINSSTVPDKTVKPVVTANAVSVTCAVGTGSASATIGGTTAGYKFEWYKGAAVKPSADFTGSSYSNLSAGSYTVQVTDNSNKCISDPVTVSITQTAPVTVTVTGVVSQTSCDSSLPNGSAAADVGGTTSGYKFEWFRGQNTLASNLVANTPTASSLAAGIYTVRATSNATGCSDKKEVTINSAVVTPSLIVAAVGDLTNCTTPNGNITVNVSLDAPSDYTFSWYTGPVVKAAPDFTDTDNVLSNLPVGTYTVRAVHKTKHCITGPISAEVKDNTPVIDIVQNSTVKKLPSDCKAHNGLLEVSVSATGNTLGFKIEWFRNFSTTPFATISSATVSRQDTLSSALYTIRATNLNNGCAVSKSFELPFATAQSLDFISKAGVVTCSPGNEGNIVVQLTPTPATVPGPPAVTFSVSDYRLDFYNGQSTQGTPARTFPGATGSPNGNGTANYTFGTLTPGYYTVVAVETNPLLGGCPSVPLVVEIKQNVTYPQIVASQVNTNTNCAGSTANGSIQLDIDGASAAESDYTYAWFEGAGTSSPALGTGTTGTTSGAGNIAQNLPSGQYTVRVTNNTTLCQSTRTIPLLDNPPIITITSSDLTITDVTRCSAMNGGAAQLNTIQENGSPVPVTNYTFTWFDSSQNILPNAGSPNNTPAINGLGPGIYSLKVTKTNGASGINCPSTPLEFEIQDKTINTIGISLADFTKPTRCLQSANLLGELVASASGTSSTGYSYAWHAGSGGALVATTATLSGISIPLGQQEITFTLVATNNSNDCSATETFVLPLEIVPVTLTASASPITSCISDNGSIFSTVTSGNTNAYTYAWYQGNTVKTASDFTGKTVSGLSAGTYTVMATDPSDTFCQSEPATVTVTGGKVFPVVTALQISPLTICDPERPNGVAKASVNGDVINYDFDWYAGAPPAGAPFYTGSEFGNLTASTFSIVATDRISGCSDTTQVTITQNILPIPVPQVVVESNVTSCVTKNGMLSASVNGNTSDFVFHWYDINPGNPSDTTRADFKGEVFSNLAEGTYFASATSRLTGCISAPAPGGIVAAPVYPEFDFVIENPGCTEYNPDGNTNGDPTGSLTVSLQNPIDLESITWYSGGTSVGTGPVLGSIESGEYEAEVISTLGCRTAKSITLLPDVHPFNGISRNGDNQNPIFYINCIENFPNNLVKIYNRAGTLVYEMEGYNNSNIYFEGKSNKGISLMGSNLPDGTYFYIIDKRDGSKKIAGYLEVVN